MIRSLYSGVSGLLSQQLQMDVIGNNISNVNTIGFKSSRMNFQDQVSQLMSGAQTSQSGSSLNPVQIGLGVRAGGVDKQFTQGILQTTNIATDLGLQGAGFFVLGDDETNLYTRSGNFRFDQEGNLVTQGGIHVKGWMADANGQLSQGTTLDPIKMDPNLIFPAIATTQVNVNGNLDASAELTQEVWTSASGFTIAASGLPADGTADLNSLSQATTPLIDGDTIVISGTDSDGSSVSATFTYGAGNDGTTLDDFLTTIDNAFSGATATLDADGNLVLTGDNAGKSQLSINLANGAANTGRLAVPGFHNTVEGVTPSTTGSVLVYDSLGNAHALTINLTRTANEREWAFQIEADANSGILFTQGAQGTITFQPDGSVVNVNQSGGSTLQFDPNNGASPVSLQLNFGQEPGTAGLSLFQGAANVQVENVDGQPAGKLSSFIIDESGKLFGSFTNGQTRLIAQVAVSRFNNPSGLTHMGGNLFQETTASGKSLVGKAGEEFDTTIHAGTLEGSNVDLTEEFTEMIIAQRAFQANARTITVSDQFLNEVVQLKR